nr:DMT family transporter [Sciscionella marina]
MSMTRSHGLRSLARMGLLACLFGSSFLWIKLALGGFEPLQLVFGRLVLGALVLFAIVKATGKRLPRTPGMWLRILVPAVVGNAIPFCMFAFGERTVDSGLAGVLNATTPLWALLIGFLLGSERLSNITKTIGLLLGFGGVLVIFAPWQASGIASWGAAACLLAAASYAVSYTYIARVLSGKIAPTVLATGQLGMAAVLIAVTLPIGGELKVHLSLGPSIALAVLGIAGTGLAFWLNNVILVEEGAVAVASVGYLLPIVSVLLGAIALGEPLNWRVVIGMVIVLAGILLTRLDQLLPGRALTRGAGRSPSGTARTGSTAESCAARSTHASPRS